MERNSDFIHAAELHYVSQNIKKRLDSYLRLRQGHRHIPYARPNLISTVIMVKSDKWHGGHYRQRAHITKNVADFQPHIQTSSETIHRRD